MNDRADADFGLHVFVANLQVLMARRDFWPDLGHGPCGCSIKGAQNVLAEGFSGPISVGRLFPVTHCPKRTLALASAPEFAFQQRTIPLGIRITCKGRPPIDRRLALQIQPDLTFTHFIESGVAPVTDEDKQLFAILSGKSQVAKMAAWSMPYPINNKMIDYRKGRLGKGVYQAVSVEKLLRHSRLRRVANPARIQSAHPTVSP